METIPVDLKKLCDQLSEKKLGEKIKFQGLQDNNVYIVYNFVYSITTEEFALYRYLLIIIIIIIITKNIKFNTLETKVNNLEKKIPDVTTLIHINQYNADKQNLEKTIGNVVKKTPNTSGLVTTTVLKIKISEVESKVPDNCKYITTQEYNKLTGDNFVKG